MRHNNYFKNKRVLVLGGTGSIGTKVIDSLVTLSPKVIKIFSRDEYKQHKLRYKYTDLNFIDYNLGDIRDIDSLNTVCKNIDIIFHCAALKHVPISEEMPEEFIKTNILGSLNVKKAALLNNVPTIVSISSDKAVDSANLMGLTKAVQEKIFASHYLKEKRPGVRFINVRFGNVIGSHGSLFPIIYHQIMNNQPITLTHPEMTRFYMSQQEAIDLILWSAVNGNDGEIIIKKMKSAKIIAIINGYLKLMKKKQNWPIKNIGLRVGEKMHESLITEDNLYRTKEKDQYYVVSPYNPKEIISDKMLNAEGSIQEKNKFMSNNRQNYMSNAEISCYIAGFIKWQQLHTSYL
ncbi:polysaccharide biosynthesis protein [Candidatus Roizmanbacteria bacterium]|nr:polysaccharide biosynthesis protein [Candidatus Roizmanbacteria bacterium]